MKANTLSINIYIYILVCLVCLTSSDKEGYFFIATSNKAWKFILNDSENAKIFADKLKKEGPMNITFNYMETKYESLDPDDSTKVEKVYTHSGEEFDFWETEEEIEFEPYEINGILSNLDFYVTKSIKATPGTKIGILVEGLDKLTEFDSSLCIEDQETRDCTANFTLAYTEVDDEKVAEKSKFPWLIILILIFAALGIGIPIYLYFF